MTMPKARKPQPNFPTMDATQIEKAREVRRRYQREWNANNRDKRRLYMMNYWARKAEQMQQESGSDAEERTDADA